MRDEEVGIFEAKWDKLQNEVDKIEEIMKKTDFWAEGWNKSRTETGRRDPGVKDCWGRP